LYFFHKLLLESFSINTFALVAKISQDAKERMTAGNNQYVERPTAQGREGKTETGEATEVLAKIAGTG
jgi:hypothetical protein